MKKITRSKIMSCLVASALLFFWSFSSVSHASDEGDMISIKKCLKNWKKYPFSKTSPPFRVISAHVKVMGIGHSTEDTDATPEPELILVKPNVAVMSKATMKLLNPNGWYCMKGKVAVLGKTEIDLACNANLTSTDDGATVLGSDKAEDGVTVLGSSTVKRIGNCAGAEKDSE
jgi:hypothetical protein